MVIGKTVDTLKERPKEERTAVAASVAVFVVVILIIGWAFFFVKKLAKEPPSRIQGPAGADDSIFDFSSLDKATQEFTESYSTTRSQIESLRNEAADQEYRSRNQDPALQLEQNLESTGSSNPF